MSRALRTAVLPLRQIWPRQTSGRAVQSVVHTSTTRLYSTTSSLHNTTGPSGNNSSVSALEVTHFTNLASSWWDPHGPSRLLHLMNPLRHDFIRSCQFTSAEGTVDAGESERAKYTYLDIGCGGGIFASSAARLPGTASVTAIDPTPEVIKVAKEHQRGDPLLSQKGRLNYVNCAIEDLSSHTEARDGFDFVTLFEVIEHIDKPSTFLRQALNHLKPGGWLIGSTIARHPVSYLTTKVIAEAPWPIGVVPRGTHDWDKYINPSELKGWFTKENREARARGEEDVYGTVKVEGCLYLPLVGWKFVNRSEKFGNYFFGVQKLSNYSRAVSPSCKHRKALLAPQRCSLADCPSASQLCFPVNALFFALYSHKEPRIDTLSSRALGPTVTGTSWKLKMSDSDRILPADLCKLSVTRCSR